MPYDTRLRQIHDDGVLDGQSLPFGKFMKDLSRIRANIKHTSVTHDEFERALGESKLKRMKILKQVAREADLATTAHTLRMRHAELLHFTPTHLHPLWNMRPSAACLQTRWLLNSVQQNTEQQCRLCKATEETREHLLLYCPATKSERDSFIYNIENISLSKLRDFQTCPIELRMAWILAGGTSLNRNPDQPRNNRLIPRVSPFHPGRSVSPIKGKKDPDTCWRAYDEYKQIHSELPRCIEIYTDGSAEDGHVGVGIVIVTPDKTVRKAGVPFGEGTNNMAELEAIHYALQWIEHNIPVVCDPILPIHIFTDSKYARDILLSLNLKEGCSNCAFIILQAEKGLSWNLLILGSANFFSSMGHYVFK